MDKFCQRSIHFGVGQQLFGWYHPSKTGTGRDCGVVLCNPLGRDLVYAHRSQRHLAEKLALAGFSVLRFDYHGTGDLFGDDRDTERVATWCADIVRAVDELRMRSGVRYVALTGLRLGATLAAFVGPDRDDIACVALWAPYDSGSAFISEVTKEHEFEIRFKPKTFSGGSAEAGGREACGSFFSDATVAELAAVDLLSIAKAPARDVMVIGNAKDHLVEHFRGLGCKVKYQCKREHSFLMMAPHLAPVPHETINEIIAFLSDVFPPFTHRGKPPAGERPPSLTYPSRSERPVSFGTQHCLFGILTEPRDRGGCAEIPEIIMLNAGGVYRIGPNRLYVTIAANWRHWDFPFCVSICLGWVTVRRRKGVKKASVTRAIVS